MMMSKRTRQGAEGSVGWSSKAGYTKEREEGLVYRVKA